MVDIEEVTADSTEKVESQLLKNNTKMYDKSKENLSPAQLTQVEDILQSLQRDINCLHDGTRFAKRKALERIQKQTSEKLEQEVLSAVFAGLCKPLLTLFHDSVEKCREVAVTMVTEMTSKISDISSYLPYIIPICVMRLGQKDIVEPSEEIRQLMLELLVQIISLSPNEIPFYCHDIMVILVRTIVDPFAEVKKLSCVCVINLSKLAPRQFYTGANSLMNPLLRSISHQHQKVRTMVVRAIGALLNNGDNKMIEEIISHLAQRTFDPCPPVRAAVYEVVGGWMCSLMDRYSYFHRLLPLILTGVQDEVTEISVKSRELLEAAGKQWEQENEQEIKDELDFAKEFSGYYGVLSNEIRPRLGCRILVNRNLSKILPGLLNDLNTWVDETRLKSVKLLYAILIYSEEHTTQHLEKVMYSLYKASMSPVLESDVDMCGQALAQFIQPKLWKEFIISALQGASTGEVKSRVGVSPQLCTSCLRVLSSLVRGSKHNNFLPVTSEVLDTLCTPEVNESSHPPLYEELSNVVSSLLNLLGSSISTYSSQILFLLLRLCSVSQNLANTESMIIELANLQGKTVGELYMSHAPELIEKLQGLHKDWTRHSPDHSLFGELLLRSGPAISKVMPEVYNIFKDCTSKEKDPELRMSMFALLGRVLREMSASSDAAVELSRFSVELITNIILPNLEWRAGRTAGMVRCSAISALWALLKSELVSVPQFKEVQEDLVSQLLANLDDDDCATRLLACYCTDFVLKLGGKECFPPEKLHKTYLELLKRLDDSSDELRICVTKTLATFFSLLPDDYDRQLFKAHLQALYRGLLIHLDDPNEEIQEGVYQVLLEGGKIYPEYLCEHVDNVKHKHRSSLYCDKLLAVFRK